MVGPPPHTPPPRVCGGGGGGPRLGGGGGGHNAHQSLQRPPDLARIGHQRLDEAVFAAYGWPSTLGDEEILERLLALNLERAG